MATQDNKVTYGLKNVHVHTFTDDGNDITYGASIPWRGAVNITLTAAGGLVTDYADDGIYNSFDNNQGFTGKFSVKQLPFEIASIILGDVKDSKGVIAESLKQGKPVALSFEFIGDAKAVRHILYNVSFSRPGVTGDTKSDKTATQTNELDFTAGIDPYLEVAKAKTSPDTDQTVYDAWFETPYRISGTFSGTTTP